MMGNRNSKRKSSLHSQVPDCEVSNSNSLFNCKPFVLTLYIFSALIVALDPLVHKHGPFEIEHLWGFYALCGFLACVVL